MNWSTTPVSACRTTIATEATRTIISYRTTIYASLHRPNTDMEFRDSFSKLKKKVKHRLTGSKPKPDKTGADVGGERVDSTGSLAGAGPRVVAGSSHDQGHEANADGGRVISTVPQQDEPDSAPARGSVDDKERRGAYIDRGEVEKTHSHVHLVDVEVAEGSGPAERKDIDGERIYPSPSITSIPRDGKPDSA